jgi:hypothetical protein
MCYRCGKHGHFIAECPKAMEVKLEHKHRLRTNLKHRSRDDYKGQEQVRAEVNEEWWSQEEGVGDGCWCKRHRLKLLLLFIELK